MDHVDGLVSVILTSYQRPNLVQEAIRSVLGQTYRNLELIIGDDNSGLQTWNSILHTVNGDKRASFFTTDIKDEDRPKKCRYAVVINQALERARGEFVSYLTDDDLYYPYRLERMIEAFKKNDDAFVVYGSQRIRMMSNAWQVTSEGVRSTIGVTKQPECRVDHNSFMHRRVCLESISRPYWPEEPECWINGDAHFFSKLTHLGGFAFYPVEGEPLDEHRWHFEGVQGRLVRHLSPVYAREV